MKTACGDKFDWAMKCRDSGEVDLATAKIASLIFKTDQALVMRTMSERMSMKVMNMAAELRAEVRNSSNRQIVFVTFPDNWTETTNMCIC